MKVVPAVKENDHFHLSFLRAYPDADQSCVRDYGKGPQRLSHADIQKFTTGENTEWKRRIDMAVSITACTVCSLAKTADSIPETLDAILPESDTSSILKALPHLRKTLVESDEGKDFVLSCKYLDASKDMARNPVDMERHIMSFMKYLATNQQRTVGDSTTLLGPRGKKFTIVHHFWALEARS